MVRVGIIGGTGYTGSELLRLLVGHPRVEVVSITSRGEAGVRVDAMFPHLRGCLDLAFVEPSAARLHECDVVFFATPNGTAMGMVPELLAAEVRVVDLAADFRLRDALLWKQWYGMEHLCPDLLDEAVYGLPEINREAIRGARLVANPGCYPTAVLLGFAPLLEAGVAGSEFLLADAKSGVSGAGRQGSVAMLMAEAGESFKAYGIPGHRHLPEIVQGLRQIGGSEVGLTFVPHLVPMIRGIEATLYARLADGKRDLQMLYEDRYRGEPFVDVMPPGAHPETRSVRGANLCRIAVHRPQGGAVVVVSAVIDNLVKGAAGQAVQNMNLMFGFAETSGLGAVALQP
jgi:N-acetyl-gamma-glutamyl-phosphate reductase